MARLTEEQAIRRLLDRFGFGAGGSELAEARRAGWRATLSTVLSPESGDSSATPPPELAPYQRVGKKDDPEAKKEAKKERKQQLRKDRTELTVWWLDRMVAAEQPPAERLTWFWHGHFATSAQKVRRPALMLAQNETFRRLGRGAFADLAQAMIVDPAMLIWLDGNDNTAKAPNENLSREFLELFALGHGHYTEADVKRGRPGADRLEGRPADRRGHAAGRASTTADKTILGPTGDFDAPVSSVSRSLEPPCAPVRGPPALVPAGRRPTPPAATRSNG